MSTLQTPPLQSEREERELIPPDSPLAPFISVNPGRMASHASGIAACRFKFCSATWKQMIR